MWPFQAPGGDPRSSASSLLAGAPPGFQPGSQWTTPSGYAASPPGLPLASPWAAPSGWDQAALAHSFSTMGLTPLCSGSLTPGPPTTPLQTPVYSLLLIPLLPLFLRPSWWRMVRAFLSHLWVLLVLMAPFVFLMFLLPRPWFTISFLFVGLQLTIPVLWSLTLLVIL
jgi:hypothetical protein